MATDAEVDNARPEIIRDRPTARDLTIAAAVLVAAAVVSLLAGPGIGVLIITLAVVAASLWRTYGTAHVTAPATRPEPAKMPAPSLLRPSLPSISKPSFSIDRSTAGLVAAALVAGSILSIVLVGAFLFLKDRNSNPPGFFADEAAIGMQTWKLLHWDAATSRVPFFYHHLEYTHLGTLSLFATTPFVALFGLTDHAVRGASAFWTILGAVFVYLALRRLKIPYAAVAVIAMLVSPLVILIARVNFGHAPSFAAMSIGFLLWIVGRQDERRWIAFAGGVLVGLSAYGQSSYYVAAPLLLLAVGVTEIAYNRTSWRSYVTVAWFGIGAVMILLPVPYRALTDPSFLDRYDDKTVGADRGWDRISNWIHAFPDYFSVDLLFGHSSNTYLTRHGYPGAPFMFGALLIFLVVGVVALFALRGDASKRFVWPMALVLLLFPIPDIVTRNAGDSPYSFSLVWGAIAIPFVIGYGVKGIQVLTHRLAVPRATLVYAGAVLAISFWNVNGFWNGPFANYPNVAADYWGWQYGPKPAADYFKAHAGEYDEFYLSGDFNAAYILTEFFMHDSAIQSVTHTGGLEYVDLSKRQLFAVRADEWQRYMGSQYPVRSYLELVATIDYPNGLPAMYMLTLDPELLHLDERPTPAG